MENTSNLPQLKAALNAESIQKKFNDMLGKKASGFMTSITTAVSNNALLQKADVNSIILAASQSAALDLPVNPNLGYSALVPFYDGKQKKTVCQFQIMTNGYVELAMRSGQFSRLTCSEVYEGELVSKNRFTDEYVFDETKRVSDKIVGYMAYMRLTNGFEKTVYWTYEEVKAHGIRYSQTFKKNFGLWVDNFNAMAKKSVLKNLLVKYAPKSIEMQNAFENDQASFSGSIDNPVANYVDNEQEAVTDFVEAEVVVEANDAEKVTTEEENK